MTYVNPAILFGLIAVAIPVLIHLFNRRKARVVDWGAMQFLKGSLVNRKRRVLIEELILMILRCLLVTTVVLAISRPFSPISSGISWFVLLPVILISAVLMAVATIIARNRAWRWISVFTAVLIAGGAVYLSQNEQWAQAARWKSTADQDVAIVIDGSGSMSIEVDGQSNFANAITEAQKLITALGPDDHVSIIVAGGIVKPATIEPINVRSDLDEIFSNLKPVGGEFSVIEALSVAASSLDAGTQPAKKIVIISDGQGLGWERDNPTRWEFVADTLNYLPTQPKVVARFLPLPSTFQNACISEVKFNRTVIGIDREVAIDVRVENTGYEAIEPSGIQLLVDGQPLGSKEIGVIEPGESRLISFQHQFNVSGAHAVDVKLLIEDDLADDNSQTNIAQVLPSLNVLLVDGSGSTEPLEMPSTFADIALTRSFAESDDDTELVIEPLISTQIIAATELDDIADFSAFQVVMLMDVPRLGASHAEKLTNFITRGGGLLFVPGLHCEPEFYQQWKTRDGHPVLPGKLVTPVLAKPNETKQPVEESFKHPALLKLLKKSKSNISKAVISAYWEIGLDAALEPSVIVGATMDGGEPLLVEKSLGMGRVILSAISFETSGSDLPALTAFPPFLHELTYSLAAPKLLSLDRAPDSILTFDFPNPPNQPSSAKSTATESTATESTNEPEVGKTIAVRFPDGSTQLAKVDLNSDRTKISVGQVFQTGIYQVEVDDALAEQFPQSIIKSGDKFLLPFAVSQTSTESELIPLTVDQQGFAEKYLDYQTVENMEQLVAVIMGNIPGHELWKYLAIAAVLIILAESFVSRWIAQQRKLGTVQEVEFVSEGERLSTFQTRANELLKTTRSKS